MPSAIPDKNSGSLVSVICLEVARQGMYAVAHEELREFLENVFEQPAILLKDCFKKEDTGPAFP